MPKIICPKDCPNRCASPNCHNPDICENWKRHLEEKAKIHEARRKDGLDRRATSKDFMHRAKNVRDNKVKKRRRRYALGLAIPGEEEKAEKI